jgi:hypothetical protein
LNKVIVSTYEPHFKFANMLAKSFERNVTGGGLSFYVTNSDEKNKLRNIIGTEHEIFSFQDVCPKFDSIRKSLQPYQAIKKAYALEYTDYDHAFLMDSDGFFHKPLDLNVMFQEHNKNPRVFYSNLDPRTDHPLIHINSNSLGLIDPTLSNFGHRSHHWCFEYQGWFVEKTSYLLMLNEIESKYNRNYIEVMNQTPVFFEIISYFWFMERYGHQYVNIEESLQQHLGSKYDSFIAGFYPKTHGILETLLKGLNDTNYQEIKNFIDYNNIEVVRIQDDYNVDLCLKLIKESSIKITACSELFSNQL